MERMPGKDSKRTLTPRRLGSAAPAAEDAQEVGRVGVGVGAKAKKGRGKSDETMGGGLYRTEREEEEVDSPPAVAARGAVEPGAVAVRGSGRRARNGDGGDVVDDDDGRVGTSARPPRGPGAVVVGGVNTSADADSSPLVVDSYVVVANEVPARDDDDDDNNNNDDDDDDEEIRQRILANTERAEEVTFENKGASSRRRFSIWAAIVALVVVGAVAVGIAVPLSRSSPSSAAAANNNASTSHYDPDVVASISYIEWQGSGGFAYSVRADTRQTGGGAGGLTTTSGVVEIVGCKVIVCTLRDDACVIGTPYEPGCCAGGANNCTNASRCGDMCPPPPESCYLTDPANTTCLQPECYTCHKGADGQDVYKLLNIGFAIDCLEVGTAIRAENNQTYEWAIFCGPMIAGPVPEENRGLGQYQCGAFRRGANYSDDVGGLGMEAGNFPCVYLALAECGCGPSDMHTFGLPAPSGPCAPLGTTNTSNGSLACPILCEDAGPTYASNLCRSFPGNISYWDGHNALNSSLFYEELMAPDYQLDIYLKDA